jgi:hypothetical protein
MLYPLSYGSGTSARSFAHNSFQSLRRGTRSVDRNFSAPRAQNARPARIGVAPGKTTLPAAKTQGRIVCAVVLS